MFSTMIIIITIIIMKNLEELLPEVRHLVRADAEQGDHALDHLVGVLGDLSQIDPDDVGQE